MTTRARHDGIEEPVTPALLRVLRRAVMDHVDSEERRVFAPALHVGIPGTDHRRLEIDPDWRLDAALRVDMLQAMTRASLEAGRVPLVWLTRTAAETAISGDDLDWAAAVRAAGAELGVALDLVVITKHSWHDPHTGVGRTWRRVRTRAG
ncbi:MAG: hypothetical protein FWE71_13130 [Nocardioidaceae bacterium]|nr:hypothetical protein [Nocardioidaceae bacterium]MCL2613911.1 hypothetical protein [Nocardioidaceae bacterium]